MLLLTRTVGTTIIIDENIVLTILDIRGKHITIGIDAPKHINIARGKVEVKQEFLYD